MIHKIKTLYKQPFYTLCIGVVSFICAIGLFSSWMFQRSPYHQFWKAMMARDYMVADQWAPKVVNKQGHNLLHLFARDDRTKQHPEIVKYLVQSGVNINQKSKGGLPPLVFAIQANNFEIAKWLLANGAKSDNMPKEVQWATVYKAIGFKEFGLVKLLFQKGINANIGADLEIAHYRSFLYWAVAQNHVEMVEFLLKRGVNVNHQDKQGITPLHLAVICRNLRVTKILIEAGADIKMPTKYHNTALSFAAALYDMDDPRTKHAIVQLLLKKGADSNSGSSSPLYIAVTENDIAVVRLLLQHSTKVEHNFSVLMAIAKQHQNPEMIALLQQYKAKHSR